MNFVAALTLRLVDRLTGPARQAARAIGDIERAERVAAVAARDFTRAQRDLDERLRRSADVALVADGMVRAGQQALAPYDAAARAAAAFDERMTGIGITAQLTDEQLAPLRQTILETSRSLRLLPDEVQGTFGSVLAQGIYRTREELELAGGAASRLRRLLRVQGEEVSDDEGAAFSAMLGRTFGYRADQLDRGAAMINRSTQQGAVSGATLMRALPAQSGGMAALGMANDAGLADLLAANQVSIAAAGSGEEGTRNISNLMSSLASPETVRRFREVGVNLEAEVRAGIERGISPLETIAQVTQRSTGGDLYRITELFGDRQARDGLLAISQNLDEFRRQSAELRGDDTLAAYMTDLERATGGTAGAMAGAQSAMARLRISVGTILGPAMEWLSGVTERVAAWMATGAESGSILSRVVVYGGLAFGAAALAGGALLTVAGGLYNHFTVLSAVFGRLGQSGLAMMLPRLAFGFHAVRGAVMGVNLAMLANPIGLVVAAIVVAVALVALIVRKYWQPISAFMTGVGQGIWEAVGPVFAEIGAALAPLKPVWDAVAGAVMGVVRWFGDLLRPVQMTSSQLESTTSSGRRFGQAFGAVLRALMTPVRVAVAVIRGSFQILRAVLAWRPMETLRGAWAGITGFFSGLGSRFRNFGRMLIQGLINGIRSLGRGAIDAVVGVGQRAVSGFRNALGIRSPSRVFMQMGQHTVEGLTQGLVQRGGGPVAALRAIAGDLAQTPIRLASPVPGGLEARTAGAQPAGAATVTRQAGAEGPRIGTLIQNFHLTNAPADVRELARELDRLSRQGQRAALHDGATA